MVLRSKFLLHDAAGAPFRELVILTAARHFTLSCNQSRLYQLSMPHGVRVPTGFHAFQRYGDEILLASNSVSKIWRVSQLKAIRSPGSRQPRAAASLFALSLRIHPPGHVADSNRTLFLNAFALIIIRLPSLRVHERRARFPLLSSPTPGSRTQPYTVVYINNRVQ